MDRDQITRVINALKACLDNVNNAESEVLPMRDCVLKEWINDHLNESRNHLRKALWHAKDERDDMEEGD